MRRRRRPADQCLQSRMLQEKQDCRLRNIAPETSSLCIVRSSIVEAASMRLTTVVSMQASSFAFALLAPIAIQASTIDLSCMQPD